MPFAELANEPPLGSGAIRYRVLWGAVGTEAWDRAAICPIFSTCVWWIYLHKAEQSPTFLLRQSYSKISCHLPKMFCVYFLKPCGHPGIAQDGLGWPSPDTLPSNIEESKEKGVKNIKILFLSDMLSFKNRENLFPELFSNEFVICTAQCEHHEWMYTL